MRYLRVLAMGATLVCAASAYGFSASTNVALIPNNSGEAGGAGQLPTTDAAFSGITFTNVPLANVSAATLAAFDTAVLNQVCSPLSQFSASQRTDIVNFVQNGGKLIIYDSDACGTTPVDYSWLPFPLSTNSPGQTGDTGGTLTIVEDNALASSKPGQFFINAPLIATDTDGVGDANVMVTKDPDWCGSMEATNTNDITGFVHAYARFGTGLFIYNGLDTNFMSTSTAPGTTDGIAFFAKLWLQELQIANASTLRCSAPVVGTTQRAPVLGPIGLALTGTLLLVAGVLLSARKRSASRSLPV